MVEALISCQCLSMRASGLSASQVFQRSKSGLWTGWGFICSPPLGCLNICGPSVKEPTSDSECLPFS